MSGSPAPMTAFTFALAAVRYWTGVFPRTCKLLRCLRSRAVEIPDPNLRAAALQALAERRNMEGAAAFAVFVPRRARRSAIDALVAYQTIYNYTDALTEHPYASASDARQLQEALVAALDDASRPQADYYAHHPWREDGGFLAELVDRCRAAVGTLPGYAALAPSALEATERIVRFQELTCGGEEQALVGWAARLAPQHVDLELEWWEWIAATGSSLEALAAIAASACGAAAGADFDAVARAYFPWIGALHTLLDSLQDEIEDARDGQLSLIGCYSSTEVAQSRMCWLAAKAMEEARALPDARHVVLLAAMGSFYLSAVERDDDRTAALATALERELGGLARAATLAFTVRRALARTRGMPARVMRSLVSTVELRLSSDDDLSAAKPEDA